MYSSFFQVAATASLPSGEILGPDLKRIVTHIGGRDCLEARGMAEASLAGVANPVLREPQSRRVFCPTSQRFSSVSQRLFACNVTFVCDKEFKKLIIHDCSIFLYKKKIFGYINDLTYSTLNTWMLTVSCVPILFSLSQPPRKRLNQIKRPADFFR